MTESLKVKEVKSGKKNGVEIERIAFSDGKVIYRRMDKNTFFPNNVPEKYLSLIKEYRFRQEAESEVARIMQERGYTSEKYKDKLERSKKIDFAVQTLKMPILIALAICGVFGGLAVIAGIAGGQQISNSNGDSVRFDPTSQTNIDYLECINKIDSSEISIEDAEFWEKYVDRYESMLSCYNQFPNIVSASDKSDLENKISYFKEKAESAEANDIEYRRAEAASEKKYQETLAQNQAEYERKKAELDAETEKKLKEYDKQRDERNAQYAKEQAEREAKQARCNSFRAEYPDVDTYKKKNGNLDELWEAYQNAKSEYDKARSIWNGAIRSGVEKRIEVAEKTANEKQTAMDAARSAWSSKNISLGNEYNEQYRQACL